MMNDGVISSAPRYGKTKALAEQAQFYDTLRDIQLLHQTATNKLVAVLDLQTIIPFDCQWEIEREPSLRAWGLVHWPPDGLLQEPFSGYVMNTIMTGYTFHIMDKALRTHGLGQMKHWIQSWHHTLHTQGPLVAQATHDMRVGITPLWEAEYAE